MQGPALTAEQFELLVGILARAPVSPVEAAWVNGVVGQVKQAIGASTQGAPAAPGVGDESKGRPERLPVVGTEVTP